MNKKAMYAIVAVVIIIIVVGIAAYVLLNNNTGGTGGTSPTPTAPASVTGASTLQFNSNLTSQGTTIVHKWAGKNIHTDNLTIRVDVMGGAAGNYSYILDTGQQKSSTSVNGGAWTASDYTIDWNAFGPEWNDYLSHFANWSGTGDVSYTNQAGEGVVLYNISVNPTLPDSTFATS